MNRLTPEQKEAIYDATGLPPHMIEAIGYAVTPMLAGVWDEAIEHVEPLLPTGVKRDAMNDNPYRDA